MREEGKDFRYGVQQASKELCVGPSRMTGKALPGPHYPKDPELLHQSQIPGQEMEEKKKRRMRRIDDTQKQQNLRLSVR